MSQFGTHPIRPLFGDSGITAYLQRRSGHGVQHWASLEKLVVENNRFQNPSSLREGQGTPVGQGA